MKAEQSNLPKEKATHHHWKGVCIIERLGGLECCYTNHSIQEEWESLRKGMLIWDASETYFVPAKHDDDFMIWKIDLASEKIPTWEDTECSVRTKYILLKKKKKTTTFLLIF